jgi:hypothetical protein
MDDVTATKTLQQTHDELAQHLCILLGQLVYGHHGITRMQALMALGALGDAVGNIAEHASPCGLVRPTAEWVEAATLRAGSQL